MRLFSTLVACAAVGFVCASVMAQDAPPRRGGDGRPGQASRDDSPRGQRGGMMRGQMPPEQAKNAWTLQAKHVAQGLGLNEDQTSKVVAAYIETRESHAKSMQELMEKMRQERPSGDPDEIAEHREAMQKSFADLNKASRDKLQSELAKTMTSEQVDKAMPALGSFNSNWDLMVHTVAGFNLQPDKNKQAMDAMQKYVVSVANAANATDPDERRAANQDARKTLSDTMKNLLDEDQFGQFQRVFGGRAGAPGRARGRGGDGGSDGEQPPAGGGRGGRGGRGGGGAGGSGGNPR